MDLEKRRFTFSDSRGNNWVAVFTMEHNYLDDYLLKVRRNKKEVPFVGLNLYDGWADLPEEEQINRMSTVIEDLKRKAECFE